MGLRLTARDHACGFRAPDVIFTTRLGFLRGPVPVDCAVGWNSEAAGRICRCAASARVAARAASGHAAALPSNPMNSRRPMYDMASPPFGLNLPEGRPQVLTADLNCSESGARSGSGQENPPGIGSNLRISVGDISSMTYQGCPGRRTPAIHTRQVAAGGARRRV